MSALTERMARDEVLHLPGVVDPMSARVAADAGHQQLYLSGAAASAVVLGRPDLGFITGVEIAELGHRIVAATGLPLLADADTGYGNAVHVAATVRRYVDAGLAGLHLEDQVQPKRCGHFAGKQVIDRAEAVQKVASAVEAADGRITVVARTDAWSVLGSDEALARAVAFAGAGADSVFVEGAVTTDDLARVRDAVGDVPLLLNRSEAGPTPDIDDATLAGLGVRLVIHPVSALLAAAEAVRRIYEQIGASGHALAARMEWPEFNRVLGMDELLADEARHAAQEDARRAP